MINVDQTAEHLMAEAQKNPMKTLELLIGTELRLRELEDIVVQLIRGNPDDFSGIMSYMVKYNVAEDRAKRRKNGAN